MASAKPLICTSILFKITVIFQSLFSFENIHLQRPLELTNHFLFGTNKANGVANATGLTKIVQKKLHKTNKKYYESFKKIQTKFYFDDFLFELFK